MLIVLDIGMIKLEVLEVILSGGLDELKTV
jgi:hypothetical protein